jgi:hypothetical protein
MTRRSHILTIAFRGSPYYLDYKIREGVLYGKEKGILCGWGMNILTGIAHFSYEFATRHGVHVVEVFR